jgi:type I restriction enzyme S subunit
MNHLPKNWLMVPLGKVATLQRGFDLPVQVRSTGQVPIFAANGPVGTHTEAKVKGPGVVTGRSGTLGQVHYVETDFWPLNTALWVKDFHGNDARWISRLLTWMDLKQFTRGAGVPTLNRNLVHVVEIPLPPLAEQKRIAAILDAADALRAKRRESLAQLDTLLQSTFLDMFGDPVTNPKGWKLCSVGDVVHSASDGPHVSPKYSENGIPFLSARHIKPGKVVWEDLKYIDQEEAEQQWKKCKPEPGDILYTKGGTTGIAARVVTSELFAVWVHIALLKPIIEKVHPTWLEGMLNSSYCYTQSQRYTHGIANRDLGLKRMVKIKMYLPPLDLQRRFATIVESVEQQKARLRAHLAELDTLFASLQHRAFNGEL